MKKTLAVVLGAGALAFASAPVMADDHVQPKRVSLKLEQDPYAQPVYVAPAGGEVETYTTLNTNLLVGGAVVFGASYGGAVLAASQSDNEAFDRLYVPIAGPWLAMGEYGDCNIENEACDDETTTKVLLAADGVFQAAGAAMMVGSVLFPKTVTRNSAPVVAMKHVQPVKVGSGRGFAFSTTW